LHELGVAHGICGLLGTIELLEYREQYETDHQPDRNFGKPLIIQNQPPETGQAQMQDMQRILGISRGRAQRLWKTDPTKWAIDSVNLIEFDK
jgi:hypothetical protein